MLWRPVLVTYDTVTTECQRPQIGTTGGHEANVNLAAVASITEEPQLGQVRPHRLEDMNYVLKLNSS